jgi:cytochrome c6
MKNTLKVPVALAGISFTVWSVAGRAVAMDKKADPVPGEQLFIRYCAGCHPKGGNVINPKKTPNEENRKAHGVVKAEDIVKLMRSPGPGMRAFDENTIPDKEATEIAEYVLTTFK